MADRSQQHSLRVVVPIVAGIGNGLLAVPLVRQLRRRRPNSRICVVAGSGAMGEVFRRLDEVDRVLILEGGFFGKLRVLAAIRAQRPDVCLVPFPSNRWQYALFARLSGARRRVIHAYPSGRARRGGGVPRDRIPALAGIHDVEQNLRLLAALDIEPDLTEAPVFPLTESDRNNARDRLARAGLDRAATPIVIHAGSAQTVIAEAKRWPTERFADLVRKLDGECDADIVIVEGPGERGIAQSIARQAAPARARTLALSSGLGDAAALLEQARIYVGSDSGLAHLAAAVGTRTVTLFAPTDPSRVCPFGQRTGVVQPRGKTCAPCYDYPMRARRPRVACRAPFCIAEITAEQVFARVAAVLDGAACSTGTGSV